MNEATPTQTVADTFESTQPAHDEEWLRKYEPVPESEEPQKKSRIFVPQRNGKARRFVPKRKPLPKAVDLEQDDSVFLGLGLGVRVRVRVRG